MAGNKTKKSSLQKDYVNKTKINNNKLTLLDLVSDDYLYDELVKVEFADEKYTLIYKKFRPSMVDELLEDFSHFIGEYSTSIGEISEGKVWDYLNLHILLKFSKLTPKQKYDFEEKVDLFKKILDSKLAEKIFESFDTDQVTFVYERFNKKIEDSLNMLQKNKEARDKVVEYVENSDMKYKDIVLNSFLKQTDDTVGVEGIGETV